MLSAGELPQPPHHAAVVNGSRLSIPKMSTGYHTTPPLPPDMTNGQTQVPHLYAPPSHPESESSGPHIQHIWVVTGPAGSGKSTVGEDINNALKLPFLEGDDVCAVLVTSILSPLLNLNFPKRNEKSTTNIILSP